MNESVFVDRLCFNDGQSTISIGQLEVTALPGLLIDYFPIVENQFHPNCFARFVTCWGTIDSVQCSQ